MCWGAQPICSQLTSQPKTSSTVNMLPITKLNNVTNSTTATAWSPSTTNYTPNIVWQLIHTAVLMLRHNSVLASQHSKALAEALHIVQNGSTAGKHKWSKNNVWTTTKHYKDGYNITVSDRGSFSTAVADATPTVAEPFTSITDKPLAQCIHLPLTVLFSISLGNLKPVQSCHIL